MDFDDSLSGGTMKTMDCKITVRYCETGRRGLAQRYAYYTWFDIALEGLIKECQMSYKDIEDLGYVFVTLSESCEFKNAAYYGDELIIRIGVEEISSIKLAFSYEVIREKDSVIIARAKSSNVFVDNNSRPHSIKKLLPELHKKLETML